MRGYFRDLNPDCGGQFWSSWLSTISMATSLYQSPKLSQASCDWCFFFSKDVFSAKVQLLVSPQPYPSFFGRRVAKKQIRRTFNSKAFNRCFVRNVEKNGITPPTLFFSFNASPLHFLLVFPWGFPAIFVVFRSFSDLRKLGKDGLPSESFFAKSLFKTSGVCVKKKNTDSQNLAWFTWK